MYDISDSLLTIFFWLLFLNEQVCVWKYIVTLFSTDEEEREDKENTNEEAERYDALFTH